MNATVNNVEIQGYLGADPEFRQLQNGGIVANLSLSTSSSYKDDQGNWHDRTEWHRVSAFGNNAKRLQNAEAGKGELVRVKGNLTTRKWQDQDGNDRYTTEVKVGGYGSELTVIRTKASPKGKIEESTENQSSSRDYDLDDDIPF
jgi:single-strand DNA-binding protein